MWPSYVLQGNEVKRAALNCQTLHEITRVMQLGSAQWAPTRCDLFPHTAHPFLHTIPIDIDFYPLPLFAYFALRS